MTDAVVEIATLGQSFDMVDLSLVALIMRADIVVKAVMLLLLVASVWSWAIIFDKILTYRSLRFKIDKFEKLFWSGQSLEELFGHVKGAVTNPMASIFVAAMQEWNRRKIQGSDAEVALHTGLRQRVYQAMQIARNRSVESLEKHVSFLATVGSSAPFIGLFGTVWGIMNSFQSIAVAKNTSLAVVAPGIAEALLATAIGLFAAIPAVIFYNMFSADLNRFIGQLDNFSTELDALLSRELDEKR